MALIKITKENFEQEVINSERPVIVDFWATYCTPCLMLSPVIEEIANEREDIKVCKVDVQEEPDIAIKYGVASIPTLIIFKNGEAVNRSLGVISKEDILTMI